MTDSVRSSLLMIALSRSLQSWLFKEQHKDREPKNFIYLKTAMVCDTSFRSGKADPKVETLANATDSRQRNLLLPPLLPPYNPHMQHNTTDCYKKRAVAKKPQDSSKKRGRFPVDKRPLASVAAATEAFNFYANANFG
jgi:hypothetical protein